MILNNYYTCAYMYVYTLHGLTYLCSAFVHEVNIFVSFIRVDDHFVW